MNKIVIICKELKGEHVSGIHRNTIEILKSLDKFIEKDQVEILVPSWEDNNYFFKNINVRSIGKGFKKHGRIRYKTEIYLYKNLYAKNYIRKINAVSVDLLLLVPQFGCDVITIYDCIPELFPEQYSSVGRKITRIKRLKNQRKAVKNAKIVLTDSENSKLDIQNFYKIESDKIKVIPCGWQHFKDVEEEDDVLKRFNLNEKQFFFSLGNRLPHKNFKWISCAAKKHPQYKFVISGSSYLNETHNSGEDALKNILFTGRLSDGQVKALMRHCKAFIQPSLYEGFGIPPMEAMSVGADCIVSNVASLPEVYGNSVWYINPLDYENIDLDKIMSKPKDRNDIILNKYSWDKSAELLWEVLKELAK